MHRPEVRYPLWIDTQNLPTSKKVLGELKQTIPDQRYLTLATVALHSEKQKKKKMKAAA